MNFTRTLLIMLLVLPTILLAQTPQSIVIDGANDFNPLNLIDADGGDTEYETIDIGDVFVTNDVNNLYIGFDHEQGGWGSVQLGIAIDVNTADGGTSDPWGRQLEWSLAMNKPDFMFYTNLDNSWQAGYYWDGAAWAEITSAGPNSLGWATGTSFNEISIMLATLGVTIADDINIEVWTTQDGSTKGPLDAMANDGSQLSVPGTTIFDVTSPIPMFEFLPYVVQGAVDNDPPILTNAVHNVDSVVDVTFNEPVSAATAEIADNYSVTGAIVVGATIDEVSPNVVHLDLSSDISANSSLYEVVATGVEDNAGNVIGTDNSACFFLKNVLFRGRFDPYLSHHSSPPDGFTVEGSYAPLTWGLCDGADMVDTGDSVYEFAADFCVPGNCTDETAEASMNWKFVHNCANYENVPNRIHTLTMATGAYDTLDVWWDDLDPTQFTAHDIDVEFYVDTNVYGYMPTDTLSINGSIAPLSFDVPSITELVDDSGIYSTTVTFPEGSLKNLSYKFLLNGVYECATQSDRHLYLNDELFGGDNGPLVMPVVHYDRCNTTWRDVEVVFSVDCSGLELLPEDVVSINGTTSNSETPSFSWDIPSLNPMVDQGNGIYALSLVFADSSYIGTEYKYLLNDEYEGEDDPNRYFTIDADNFDAVGNPQILALDVMFGSSPSAVHAVPGSSIALRGNAPNPFNPMTEIKFTVHQSGKGALQVFNLKGEIVRTLLSGNIPEGPHAVSWDGLNDNGQEVSGGIYLYRLEVNGDASSRKMMLVK